MLRASLLLLAVAAACSAPPPVAISPAHTAVPADEHARTIEGMKPPKRARPVIAVVAQNDGTETTDFLIPYAVLVESGAAEVLAVAPEDRPIRLTPALTVAPQATTAAFDARYPDGADYVVVPKIEDPDDHAVVAWIQAQADKGSTIVGVCSGVKTVAAAGLVDGRAATGHWYDIDGLRRAHPTMRWVRDRRYVVDRGVVTTTGVSASLPVSLALVEAFAGRDRAAAVAADLGVATWDARHDSAAFWLDPRSKQAAQRNQAFAASPDIFTVAVADGVDEIALGFTADAWSRTMRSKALAVAERGGAIEMRRGLELLPDATSDAAPAGTALTLPVREPARALPAALRDIAGRYGDDTAAFVALQLEYVWPRSR